MLNFILNKIFPPMPALIISHSSPFSEAARDAAQDRARELTGSGPTFRDDDMEAILKAMEVILAQPVIEEPKGKRGGPRANSGRPRIYPIYDMEVGEICRQSVGNRESIRVVIHRHSKATGKQFEMRTRRNGLWIERLA